MPHEPHFYPPFCRYRLKCIHPVLLSCTQRLSATLRISRAQIYLMHPRAALLENLFWEMWRLPNSKPGNICLLLFKRAGSGTLDMKLSDTPIA